MRQVIGIHLGASFAEACALDESVSLKKGAKPLATARWYLPRQPLRTALPKWIAENGLKPDALFITTRSLERIYDFRMGGTTAQLVTRGMERWPFLSGTPANPPSFFRPVAPLALSSADLSFGIDERVTADGLIEKPLSLESVEAVASKLKAQEIKKICLHFLHAGKNPANENAAADYLEKQGFEVFRPAHSGDENADWRANTLDASLSGSMEELRGELEKAIEGLGLQGRVHFATGHGDWMWDRKDRRLSSQFGADRLLKRDEDTPDTAVLNFGWDSWRVVKPGHASTEWKSQWGPVHQPSSARRELFLQPTQALRIDEAGGITVGDKSETYEPGPLWLGRGQKPLVVDVLGEKVLAEWAPANAPTRVASALQALVKSGAENFRDAAAMSAHLHKSWAARLNRQLWLERDWKNIRVRGPFASLWWPSLQEAWKDRAELDETTDAELVARAGLREGSL